MDFQVPVPTPMIFMLRPRSGHAQWISAETYLVSPITRITEFTDAFGNLCQRLVAPVGDLTVRTSVDVLLPHRPAEGPAEATFVEIPDLPDPVLVYLLPSRFCESDRFGDMATDIVGNGPTGYPQVVKIVDWVRDNIQNEPLSSTYPVSAAEVNQRRVGVCRDLAHIAIALCRALAIPARLAVGYVSELEPMDIHAWFQAYVGGQWYDFDPSQPEPSEAQICVAQGRDAADVAIYNQFGPLLLPSAMRITMQRVDGPS